MKKTYFSCLLLSLTLGILSSCGDEKDTGKDLEIQALQRLRAAQGQTSTVTVGNTVTTTNNTTTTVTQVQTVTSGNTATATSSSTATVTRE
ncbi:MAG: hypothetical protein EOP11_00500 [Proteobacteria bacterium]|nr:MAG: hypothetical protein EOP11_00500 [Pseudomonadota bacterium]